MKRVAINGLGRIGRLVVRHYMEAQPEGVELVAANDLVPTDDLAYLIKYDSVHGVCPTRWSTRRIPFDWGST